MAPNEANEGTFYRFRQIGLDFAGRLRQPHDGFFVAKRAEMWYTLVQQPSGETSNTRLGLERYTPSPARFYVRRCEEETND